MRVALIGRTQMLYNSALALAQAGHELRCVLTAPAAPEYTRTEADFERLATRLGCPFLCARSAAAPEALAMLSGCDIGVSMNWVGVLGPEVLDLFPLGVLNAHPGELPRYRGNACQGWAILRGEERLGLSIHVMRPGELDCGRVVHQEFLDLTPEVANAEVWAWLEAAVPQGFVAALDRLGRDPGFTLFDARADDPAGFRGYPRLPVDGYIDWTRPALDIARLVRAAGPPLPGAYTYADLGGRVDKLAVLEARPHPLPLRDLAVPGHILRNDPQSGVSLVACGQGALELLRCRDGSGREYAPGREWKSIRLRLGIRAEDMVWMMWGGDGPH